MKRVFAVAAMLFAAMPAVAQISFALQPPYYVDDTIRFSVAVPHGARVDVAGPAINLEVSGPLASFEFGGQTRVWFMAQPKAAGRAELPPFLCIEPGRTTRIDPVAIEIQPQTISDAGETALKSRGRAPAFASVEVKPANPVVGDLIEVRWWGSAATPETTLHFDARPRIAEASWLGGGAMHQAIVAGVIMRQTMIDHAVIVAKRPGAIIVPQVSADGVARVDNVIEPVRRLIPSMAINVRPGATPTPAGSFEMSDAGVNNVSPGKAVFSVLVTGTADVVPTRPPLFGDLLAPYVIHPQPLQLLDRGTHVLAQRRFVLELHAVGRDLDIPAITYSYYDAQGLPRRITEAHRYNRLPKKSAPQEQEKAETGLKAVAVTFGVLDVLLLIAILIVRSVCSL